jgi:hypothetical protein
MIQSHYYINMGTLLDKVNVENPFITDEQKEAELRRKGHTCIGYIETLPPTLSWCEQTPCIGDPYQREREQELKERELKQQGHTCITYLECMPPRISWCCQEPCINNPIKEPIDN